MTIRVLIAEDQALLRDSFAVMLGAQPDLEVVATAEDGVQAVALAAELHPDVVVMDIRMPNLDGIEALRRIVERAERATRVLILTTFDLDEYVYEALRAGAGGFLLKDASGEELAQAVRTVASGEALLAPGLTMRLIHEFTRVSARPRPGRGIQISGVDGLTPREREVLVQVAFGLSNAEIAGALVIAEETVKTHVGRILTKLRLRDRTQAAILAYQCGLVVPGTPG